MSPPQHVFTLTKRQLLALILLLSGYLVMPDGPWYREVGAALLCGYAWWLYLDDAFQW